MIRRHSIQILTIASAAFFLSIGLTSLSSAEAVVSGVESGGLVFVAASDEEMDLWRARLADGALQQISATPKQEERWPVWSVEANRLAYVARNTEGFMKSTVKLLDLETGKESELGPNPDNSEPRARTRASKLSLVVSRFARLFEFGLAAHPKRQISDLEWRADAKI